MFINHKYQSYICANSLQILEDTNCLTSESVKSVCECVMNSVILCELLSTLAHSLTDISISQNKFYMSGS